MAERRLTRWTPGTKYAMRQFIFEFEQSRAIELGLGLVDLLLLDYFLKFFQDGRAKMKLLEGKRYFLIRYAKILSDLPVLRRSDKTMRRMMAELERKQILARHVKGKRDLYVCINWNKVFDREKEDGQNCPAIVNIDGQNDQQADVTLDNSDQPPGQNRATIDSYDIKKIKIITDTRACEIDRDLLLREIHKQLDSNVTSIAHELWFGKIKITDIADNFIEFEFPSVFITNTAKKECYLKPFEDSVHTSAKLFIK